MRHVRYLLYVLLLFAIFFVNVDDASAQCPPQNSVCNAFVCYDETSGEYVYNTYACAVATNPQPPFGCQTNISTSTLRSTRHENTNPNPAPWPSGCGALPAGCGQGLHGGNIPTCSGDEGGDGGGCPHGGPVAGGCLPGNCGTCAQYTGQCCSAIPAACRSELSGCGGGGAPTATPTPSPTPVPYCTLECPGTEISQAHYEQLQTEAGVRGISTDTLLAQAGTGTGGTSTGTNDDNDPSQSYYYASGIAEGDITFNGYENFDCRGFTDGDGYSGECPRPTPGTTHGGGGGTGDTILGATTRRLNGITSLIGSFMPQSLVRYLRSTQLGKWYGQVLGSSTQLLAQTGTGTGGSGTSSGVGDTTWIHPVKYHQLNESATQFYTATATHTGSGGGTGTGGSSDYTCSCSVALVCPVEASDVNGDDAIIEGCDNQCDFSIEPDLSVVGTPLEFTLENPPGFDNLTVDFDDGTVIEDASGITEYTYTDSGTYDITLTCSSPGGGGGASRSCTRRFTSYCSGTDLENLPTGTPTPTPTPGPWMKVEDSAVHIKTYVNNTVPADALPFDVEDIAACSADNPNPYACFNSGNAGAVTTKSVNSEFGDDVSANGWLRNDFNYSLNNLITPSAFIEYVKARKDHTTFPSLDANQIQANSIYIVESDAPVSINDDSIPDRLAAGEGVVIIIDGDLVIDMAGHTNATFNALQKAVTIIVTGTTEISSATFEINAVLITNAIDFAYDADPTTETPLKVSGNLAVMNTPDQLCQQKRVIPTSLNRPVCKFEFDFVNQYVPVIDLISTRTYEWTELTP